MIYWLFVCRLAPSPAELHRKPDDIPSPLWDRFISAPSIVTSVPRMPWGSGSRLHMSDPVDQEVGDGVGVKKGQGS